MKKNKKKHGGKRPGAGRKLKPQKETRGKFTITILPKSSDFIRRAAAERDLSNGKFVELLIELFQVKKAKSD